MRSIETVSEWANGSRESNRTPTEWVPPAEQGGPPSGARQWLCDETIAGTTRKLLGHWRLVHLELGGSEKAPSAHRSWAREQLGLLIAMGFEAIPGDVTLAIPAPPGLGVYELLKRLKQPPR